MLHDSHCEHSLPPALGPFCGCLLRALFATVDRDNAALRAQVERETQEIAVMVRALEERRLLIYQAFRYGDRRGKT